jgi:hypothetical protein
VCCVRCSVTRFPFLIRQRLVRPGICWRYAGDAAGWVLEAFWGGIMPRPGAGTTDSGGGMHSLSLVPDTYSLSLERANSQFAYRSPVLSIEPCSPPVLLVNLSSL